MKQTINERYGVDIGKGALSAARSFEKAKCAGISRGRSNRKSDTLGDEKAWGHQQVKPDINEFVAMVCPTT